MINRLLHQILTWTNQKIEKRSYKGNKEFELPDEPYSVSDI